MFARIKPTHQIAVAAFDGVVPFDLSTPCEVFERARRADGSSPYAVKVCGVTRRVKSGHFDLITRHGLTALARADTVILPGLEDLGRPISPALLNAVRAAAAKGARVVSICTGAFILAATGLLDGKKATTHWLAAAELARRHPAVKVDPEVLYVDAGKVLSSAGAAAGLDLCLHLVRLDCGAKVAADTARCSVMPLEREGGQAQFIVHAAPAADGTSLSSLLSWMEEHLDGELDLTVIAKRAAMSTRSLSRHFMDQLGVSPARWVLKARVRRAQVLLETSDSSIELISDRVGFGSTATFRARFREVVGTSPVQYRRSFVR